MAALPVGNHFLKSLRNQRQKATGHGPVTTTDPSRKNSWFRITALSMSNPVVHPQPVESGPVRSSRGLLRKLVGPSPAPQTGDGFTQAYAENLSHRLPLVYVVTMVNIVTMMVTFRQSAPAALVFWLPLPMLAALLARATYWLPINVQRRSLPLLKRDIDRLPLLGSAVSLGQISWVLSLYTYGDQPQQSLIHYVTAVTCFTGILGLSHSPKTAIRMALIGMLPSSVMFLLHDHPSRIAIVGVQTAVSILLVLITVTYHRDFVFLEQSRQLAGRRKKQFASLALKHRTLAMHDPLTGALNRRRFQELLGEALIGPPSTRPWLAILDLNGFKLINDTHGHPVGDHILMTVSDRIEASRGIVTSGRMGGDEFAVLLSGTLSLSDVKSELEALAQSIAEPIAWNQLCLSAQTSIGAYKCVGASISECFERADSALYRAKAGETGCISVFTDEDEVGLLERREIAKAFTSADFKSQLKLVYQPIVDVDTGRVVTLEALVRWSRDGDTLLPPAEFIRLAEATGRIGELTDHVLATALDECPAWNWGCRLAINLSAHDILRDDTSDRIGRIIERSSAPNSSITLEITETALLSDYRKAAANLTALRAIGLQIALDDFGTGQSSLSHVHNLPIDCLKIDQSFARDLVENERSRAIVGTILSLSRHLGLQCTIEGIESLSQQAVARSIGVRQMQGYHFGRPVDAETALRDLQGSEVAKFA